MFANIPVNTTFMCEDNFTHNLLDMVFNKSVSEIITYFESLNYKDLWDVYTTLLPYLVHGRSNFSFPHVQELLDSEVVYYFLLRDVFLNLPPSTDTSDEALSLCMF